MKLDGVLADAERGRDLTIRESGRHLFEHLVLARRQRLDEIGRRVAPWAGVRVCVVGIDDQDSHAVEILGSEVGFRRDIRPHGPAGLLDSLDQVRRRDGSRATTTTFMAA